MEYNRLGLGKSLERKHQENREHNDRGDNYAANPVPSTRVVPEAPEVHFEIPLDLNYGNSTFREQLREAHGRASPGPLDSSHRIRARWPCLRPRPHRLDQ